MDRRMEETQNPNSKNVQNAKKNPPQQEKEQRIILGSFLATIHHFFGDFSPLWKNISDPRDPKKTVYPFASLAFAGILMFLCRLRARRQIGHLLRNDNSVAIYLNLFKVESFPHGDTLGKLFCRIQPDSVQEVVTTMTETLIRKKVLYPYRLRGKYFVIAIDGTGILTYSERHCSACMTRTQKGITNYYHPVLEAKLITSNGFAFSLMTEFIENPGEKPRKQDCELKAFYRLAKRLKARFPRLPILLSMDGLFAGGPTFSLCREFGWRFMIVLKDKDLSSVNQEFETLSPLAPENRLTWRTGQEAKIKQNLKWVNDIHYMDSDCKEHVLTVLECLETKPNQEGKLQTKKFKWITDIHITSKNVIQLAENGGRIRWKIENEGFNVQKNGGYELEHAYSNNQTAAKIFYFLLQIAHLFAQLIEKGNLLRKVFPNGFGSAKNLAFRILEAWRNAVFPQNTLNAYLTKRIQIRFDSS